MHTCANSLSNDYKCKVQIRETQKKRSSLKGIYKHNKVTFYLTYV